MKWISELFSILCPRFCPGCKRLLCNDEPILCAQCLMQLDYLHENNFLDNKIARLFWGQIPIERATSFLHYAPEGVTHNVVMALKYGHCSSVGLYLGRAMGKSLQEQGFFEGVDVIVPVPLHWWRRWLRGYNQSDWLARGIAEVTGLPIDIGIVRRKRNNSSQIHKSAEQRRENVKDIFVARPTSYRHILLLDDVITTGATTTTCAQAIAAQNPQACFSILSLAKA